MQHLAAFLSPAQEDAHAFLAAAPVARGQWLPVDPVALPSPPVQPHPAIAQIAAPAQAGFTLWLTTPLRGGVAKTPRGRGGDDGDNGTDPTASSSSIPLAKKRPAAVWSLGAVPRAAAEDTPVGRFAKKRPTATVRHVVAAKNAATSRSRPAVTVRTKVWDRSFCAMKLWLGRSHGVYPKRSGAFTKERRLARWLNELRRTYLCSRRPPSLGPNRILLLEALPGWTWGASHDATWAQSFEALRQWLQDHEGIYPKQHNANLDEKRLAQWMHDVRKAHGLEVRPASLSATHVAALETLPPSLGPNRIILLEALPGWT